ncbi:MAG: hypothetical protein GX640_03110 [Fibrobacter sp.]|nr:hypothetical protein [Fibrobacter sp.]
MKFNIQCISMCIVLSFASLYAHRCYECTEEPRYFPANSININPFTLYDRNINVNFEHLFEDRHGFMVEGSYYFKGGFTVGAQYRYHYFRRHNQSGLNSRFMGPFLKYERYHGDLSQSTHGIDSYWKYDVSDIRLGVNWGRRWFIGNVFNIVFRFGYGYPVMYQSIWYPHNQPSWADGLVKFVKGFDGEISVGFAF